MRRIACEDGELQITQNSISGIPVFQLSGEAARLLDCGRRVRVQINFLPEFSEEEFDKETAFRLQIDRNRMLGDLLLGLAHRKVIDLILAEEGLQAEMKAARLSENRLRSIIYRFRKFETGITGTGGFDHAQVTAGGVPLEEMDASFASKKRAGLYFAGELIDVDGRCGGYNLQWAMTSGVLAGRAAGRYVSDKNDG
jgi:predicted Rossmann fold flavoprotein